MFRPSRGGTVAAGSMILGAAVAVYNMFDWGRYQVYFSQAGGSAVLYFYLAQSLSIFLLLLGFYAAYFHLKKRSSTPPLSSLFAILGSAISDRSLARVTAAATALYGLLYAFASSILVFQPGVDFSSAYGVTTATGWSSVPCCGDAGTLPKLILYLSPAHMAVQLVPLSFLLLFVVPPLVGLNLSIALFSLRRTVARVTGRWMVACGAAVGLFTACPTCAGFFLAESVGGIGAATLAVALAPYQALFIAVSIPLLILMPFFFARRVRKAGGVTATAGLSHPVGADKERPLSRKPLNGERNARRKEAISLSLRDYLALTKPKIVWLLLLVALASAVIAARAIPPAVTLLGLLLAGTLTSLGSLALNSYLEIDVDAKMKRTRNRPLPGQRIVQPGRALAFGLSLVGLGLLVSYLTLTPLATLFIGLGVVVYVQVYTVWLKPRTSWNIVLGGFAGSCCALAGWYAVTSADPLIAWVLASLVFVWTPSHFWSLAVITEEDYSAAGIPMLPSVVGEKRAAKFIVVNTLLLIPISLLFYLYLAGTAQVVYLVGALIFDLLLLTTNVKLFVSPTKSNALLAFKASSPFLAVIFILACVSALL